MSSNGKELLGERYERGHLTNEDGGCIPRRDDAHVAHLRTPSSGTADEALDGPDGPSGCYHVWRPRRVKPLEEGRIPTSFLASANRTLPTRDVELPLPGRDARKRRGV